MDIDELLGIDLRDPLQSRARKLVEGDSELLVELKAMRAAKGLTQQDVAERMEISQSAVARIESGERDPRLSTLRRYAMAIGAVIERTVVDDERLAVRTPASSFGEHVHHSWPKLNKLVVVSRPTTKA